MDRRVALVLVGWRLGCLWLGAAFGLVASRGADAVALSVNSILAYMFITWASRRVIVAFLGSLAQRKGEDGDAE